MTELSESRDEVERLRKAVAELNHGEQERKLTEAIAAAERARTELNEARAIAARLADIVLRPDTSDREDWAAIRTAQSWGKR